MHETSCSMCGDRCPCPEACQISEPETHGREVFYFWLAYLAMLASLTIPFLWPT